MHDLMDLIGFVCQGGWEDDEDVHEAACREALEEAGVRGNINVTTLPFILPSFVRQLMVQA